MTPGVEIRRWYARQRLEAHHARRVRMTLKQRFADLVSDDNATPDDAEYRALLQKVVVAEYPINVQREICAIGERAVDAAWLAYADGWALDDTRGAVESRAALHTWLSKARKMRAHADRLVKWDVEHDGRRLASLLHELEKIAPPILKTLLHPDQDNSKVRRDRAGKPSLPWRKTANTALEKRRIPDEQRKNLLTAWGL